jgi:ParB family chromosome partitioning protein
MRLTTEKLEVARQSALAQGWKWAQVSLENSYRLKQGLDRLIPISDDLSEDDQARYTALSQEYDALAEQDPVTDEMSQRMAAIEDDLAELDNRPAVYAPEDIARAGVFIAIGHNGRLSMDYGFVRPEDMPAEPETAEPGQDDGTGERGDAAPFSAGGGDAEDEAATSLPDRVVQDLTAFRTVALRDALAHDFNVAFLAVLHAMCQRLFYRFGAHTCLQIETKTHFPANAARLGETVAAKAIDARHAYWAGLLPREPAELWDALAALADDQRAALFAHCASMTVNTVREPHQPRRDAIRHADTLAGVLSLDMTAAGWTTTAENYLGRVTKAQIMEAVREAKGDDTVRLIEPLRKGDMAKEAERLLQGTGWLPEPLRTPEMPAAELAPQGEPLPVPALPAFLADAAHGSEAVHAPAG